jgi:ArsR family transcriptional regulator
MTAHPDPTRLIDTARDESALLKALSHEARLAILCELVHAGETSVSDLEALLGRRQAAVSQQLARLRLDGIVATRREGKTIYYRIASTQARAIVEALCAVFAEAHPDAVRVKPLPLAHALSD